MKLFELLEQTRDTEGRASDQLLTDADLALIAQNASDEQTRKDLQAAIELRKDADKEIATLFK